MSLEEKVGQIIQADIGHITPEELRRYPLGAVFAGGDSAPAGGTDRSPAAWLALARALRRSVDRIAARTHADTDPVRHRRSAR